MDFLRTMITGTVAYNNLEFPSVYNSAAGRSEQCSTETPGAGWSVVIILSPDEDDRTDGQLSKHFKSVAQRDSRLGEYAGIHSRRVLDDGSIQITIRKKCKTAKGKSNLEPAIVDTQRKPVENRAFRGGSKVNVMCSALPTNSPASGKWGMSLFLEALQLVEPVYMDGGVEDFPDLSGSTDPVTSAYDDFNDAIPFD